MLNDCVRNQGLRKVETKALVHDLHEWKRFAGSLCWDGSNSFIWIVHGITSFVKANEEYSIVDARCGGIWKVEGLKRMGEFELDPFCTVFVPLLFLILFFQP